MVLSSTGQITFLDLKNEFGGTTPVKMNDYYSGGLLVAASV